MYFFIRPLFETRLYYMLLLQHNVSVRKTLDGDNTWSFSNLELPPSVTSNAIIWLVTRKITSQHSPRMFGSSSFYILSFNSPVTLLRLSGAALRVACHAAFTSGIFWLVDENWRHFPDTHKSAPSEAGFAFCSWKVSTQIVSICNWHRRIETQHACQRI